MVKRKSTPTTKNKIPTQGFCPLLKWLGMSDGLTPLVWSTVAQYGAITSSFEAACTTLTGWGINLSLKRIERLTYKFGQIGINLRQSKILNRQLGNLAEGNILKGQRVVIAVDGGRSRIRINKKGRKSSKTKRHGFVGKWVEPKLFTIYVVDEQGKKINSSEIPITNDGTYEGYKALLEILEADLVDLGISQAKQVLLIGDGAEWIQYYSVKHFELRIWFWEKVKGEGLKVFSFPFPLNRQVLGVDLDTYPTTFDKIRMPSRNLSAIRFLSCYGKYKSICRCGF
jgi:hypothetical protein